MTSAERTLAGMDPRPLIAEPGCIFDGVHGQETTDRRTCALAQEYGFEMPEGADPSEFVGDALNHLNEHAVAEGIVLEFDAGDLLAVEAE